MTASRGRVRLSWARMRLLGVPVGVADQGEVGLGLDPEVLGPEPRRRDPLDGIREHVGEAQVVVVAGHAPQPSGRRRRIFGPATIRSRFGHNPVSART